MSIQQAAEGRKDKRGQQGSTESNCRKEARPRAGEQGRGWDLVLEAPEDPGEPRGKSLRRRHCPLALVSGEGAGGHKVSPGGQ